MPKKTKKTEEVEETVEEETVEIKPTDTKLYSETGHN